MSAVRREREGLEAPAPGRLFWIGALLSIVAVFVLRTAYIFLDDVTHGRVDTLPVRAMEEATGALAGLLLLPVVVWAARRFAPARVGWPRAVLGHLAAFLAFSLPKTALMAASRARLAPVLGFADYDYGALRMRLLMEAPNDVITYAVVLTALALVANVRARRERERRAHELEQEMTRVQLENLQLQLQPHFLFNALNTIAAAMYDDPAGADRMIGHLADLLRHALGATGRSEVPLREEAVLLDEYVALARARFGAGLAVTVDIEPAALDALVPPMLLQPLVENAIAHGVAPTGGGRVAVRAGRAGAALRLAVENDLPPTPDAGVAARGSGRGLGLPLTRRRLALLYGAAAHATARRDEAAGTHAVTIELPFRLAGAAAAPAPPSGPAAPLPADAHPHR